MHLDSLGDWEVAVLHLGQLRTEEAVEHIHSSTHRRDDLSPRLEKRGKVKP